MDVFAFREELIAEYARFSRSFTRIRADDISREVDASYDTGLFWPAPLIQLSPNFEPGGYVDDLVAPVDDLPTAGAHYRAARSILSTRFPDCRILGLFIARRVPNTADLGDFEGTEL